MKITIFGTGSVGSALGKTLAAAGHTITYVTRSPDDSTDLLEATGQGSRAVGYDAIPPAAEAAIVALPFSVALDALDPVAGDLAGLTVIDATNPFQADGSYGVPGSSSAQAIAEVVPGAHIVKAFNTIGADVMANPDFDGTPADLFICGDNPDAKATATTLATAIGFNVIDVGELTMARHLDSMAILWIAQARHNRNRHLGWKMLRR